MAKERCLTLFPEIEQVTRKFSNEQFGALIRAVIAYRFRGEVFESEDAAMDIAFQFLSSQVDRAEAAKSKKVKAAEARWNAKTMQCDAEGMHDDAPIQSDPVQSHPVQSVPVQSHPVPSDPIPSKDLLNSLSPSGEGACTPADAQKKSFGKYGWVKLTAQEYRLLEQELGTVELSRCIAYLDESAQSTNNRNKWHDFTVIIRKCARENWGVRRRNKKPDIPKGASGTLGSAEMEAIQRVLAEGSDGNVGTSGNRLD